MPVTDGVGLAIDRIFRNNLLNQTMGAERGETFTPQPQQMSARQITRPPVRPARLRKFNGISEMRRQFLPPPEASPPPPPQPPPPEAPPPVKPPGSSAQPSAKVLSYLARNAPDIFMKYVSGDKETESALNVDLKKLMSGKTGETPKDWKEALPDWLERTLALG